jgi:predicted AAA+ superfamily ATPase
MNSQVSDIVKEKLIASAEAPLRVMTHREVSRPTITNKAIVVIGMRRTGKTTWLHQCRREYFKRGYAQEDLVFFSFEDERLPTFCGTELQSILDMQNRLFPKTGAGKRILFFDEIQLVSGWEMFVRRLLDEGEFEIYLSGSSAKLLSREIASSMRGRAWEVEIFPFSFGEFLSHRGLSLAQNTNLLGRKKKAEIDYYFEEYLFAGGLPEAQGLDKGDRFQLLQGYVDTLLMRDIVERFEIKNPTALRWLVRRLMASPGGLFSISKFALDLKSQGISAGKETLFEYLDHLEDAYLLETVSIASDSEKRKQVNPRKVYPIDSGFIPLFDRSGKSNLGHALETVVYLHLRQKKAEVAYVKTKSGFEVDFLARFLEGNEALIQVCLSIEDRETVEREIRSLLEAAGEHPAASLLLLTGYSLPPKYDIPAAIQIIPAWQWILDG